MQLHPPGSKLSNPPPSNHAMSRYAQAIGLALFLLLPVCYSFAFFFDTISNNVREIYTYNLDSTLILLDIERSVSSRWFQLDFTGYGQLYYNLCILISYLYSLLFPLTERAVFFIARLVTLLGGCASIALLFFFAKRFLGVLPALFSAAMLAVTPVVLHSSTEPHPDTWQMFFVTLSLYFCALAISRRTPGTTQVSEGQARPGMLLAAAAAAGAAFSTKYIGTLLLPLLAIVAVAMRPPNLSARWFDLMIRALALATAGLVVPLLLVSRFSRPDFLSVLFPNWGWVMQPPDLAHVARTLRWFSAISALCCLIIALTYLRAPRVFEARQTTVLRTGMLAAIGGIFLLTFAVTSPWALYKLQFFPNLYVMNSYVNFGHGTKAAWQGPQWLEVLAGSFVVGAAAAILALVGAAALVYRWGTSGFRSSKFPLILILGWTLLYLTFMVVRVNVVKSYYLLPVVPSVILLSAVGLCAVPTLLRVSAERAAAVMTAVAFVGIAAHAWQGFDILRSYRQADLHREIEPEKKAMGEWLNRCVPVEAKIMAAAYSYVPPRFTRVHLHTDQGSFAALAEFQPDVVILNRQDIAFFSGSLENSLTNLFGNTNDKLRYFESVAHSTEWRSGPIFGDFEFFLRSRSTGLLKC